MRLRFDTAITLLAAAGLRFELRFGMSNGFHYTEVVLAPTDHKKAEKALRHLFADPRQPAIRFFA